MTLNRRRQTGGTVPPEFEELRAPGPFQLMLEARAPWEWAAMLAATPWLRQLPIGDGHPVIVFPGLGATDITTAPLRTFLADRGYTAYPWKLGFNFGPRHGVLDALREQLRHVADRHRERVSLIGWSLGGVYARELAKLLPDCVRSVITLGTPFSGSHKSTNAWRVYELTSGRKVEHETALFDLPAAPPVPTTSIYTRTDGVVAWQASLQAPSKANPHTENVEVYASHIGLGLNPTAWWAVADRLAQTEGQWKPFERKGGLHGIVFPNPSR